MPIGTKFKYIFDSFKTILAITPNMVKDLYECPLLQENSSKVGEWLIKNKDVSKMSARMTKNMLLKSIPITGHVVESLNDYKNGNYHSFGL